MANRNLAAVFESFIQNDVVRPFIAVRLMLDAGDLLVWSGVGDLSLGGRTYTGAGNLLTMASVTESVDLSAPAVTLSLSGMNDAVISNALTVDYQNREAAIYFGVMDSGGDVVSNFTIFAGRISTMHISEDSSAPSVGITIASRLDDISRPRRRRLSNEEQQELYPADKGLSHVNALQDQNIEWGPLGSTAGSIGPGTPGQRPRHHRK